MGQHIFQLLSGYLAHYGYWAVAAGLLLENAGFPVPGETILLLASFMAFSERRLRLPNIMVIGTCAAVLGDNLGYWLGRSGGIALLQQYQKRPTLRRMVQRCERLFERYGSFTIFFARFVAGLRIVAGPLAGISGMSWRKFALWNLLGAMAWVTVISLVGYFVGRNWNTLVEFVRRLDTLIVVIAAAVILLVWRRKRGKTSS